MNAPRRIYHLRLSSREVTAFAVLAALLALGTVLTGGPYWSDRPHVRIVPSAMARSSAGVLSTADKTNYVNINTATAQQLVLLPGIGPVRARAIVEYRRRHGPFPTVDALVRVHGIGTVTLERLRPYIIASRESGR